MQTLDTVRQLAADARVGGKALASLMRQTGFTIEALPPEIRSVADAAVWGLIETDLKYEGYVRRQASQNRQISARDLQCIPDGFDFSRVPGLRPEARQKLHNVRPTSVGQASRISGVTPADLMIISIWLNKRHLGQEITPIKARV